MYRKLPSPVRSLVTVLSHAVPPSTGKLSLEYRLTQFLSGAEGGDAAHSHFAWRRIFTAEERARLLVPEARAAARSDTDERLATLFRTAPAASDLHRAMYADVKTFLVDSISPRWMR
jgi:hypothetical protein